MCILCNNVIMVMMMEMVKATEDRYEERIPARVIKVAPVLMPEAPVTYLKDKGARGGRGEREMGI